MDSARRRRWIVLLSALALTVTAVFLSPAPAEVAEMNTDRASTLLGAETVQTVGVNTVPVFSEEGASDPFEPRGWVEPLAEDAATQAPVEVTRVTDEVSAAPVAVEATGHSPLPYRYVGRFSDDTGAMVYLARGEVALVARVGDILDGTYKVVELQSRSLEFEDISTGMKQTLPIPEVE